MKRALQIAFGLGLSAFFIWWSLRGVDLGKVGHAIEAALAGPRVLWVVAMVAVLALVHFVRAWRWGLLLKPLASAPFREINAIAAVGFMALMVMPLRLGELGRPSLAAEKLKIRMSGALASVVVERVTDGLFMGALLVGLLWTVGGRSASAHLAHVRVGAVIVALIFALGLAFLIVAFVHRQAANRWTRRVVGVFSTRLAERLCGMLDSFIDGLAVVPSWTRFAEVVGLTAIYWALNALGIVLISRAFALRLTFLQATTVLGLQVIGVMIPAGPGMVGTMQAFTALGMKLFRTTLHPGLSAGALGASVAACVNTGWALSFAQQVSFGLYFVLLGRVELNHLFSHLWSRRRVPEAEQVPAGS